MTATNYVLTLEPLGQCDALLRLRFYGSAEANRSSLVSLMFHHGTQVRSSVDEEGQGGVKMVARSGFEACVRLKRE
jgi:hypothetical protein